MTPERVKSQAISSGKASTDEAAAQRPVPVHQGPSMKLSVRQHVREFVLKLTAALMGPVLPVVQRGRKLWWTAAVHANARKVGPSVHAYGPVRFLGTRQVYLGGWGNLYENVLFETVEAGTIEIGDDFAINRGAVLAAHDRISIGDHAMIAEYVSIRDNGHAFADSTRPMRHQGYEVAPVRIGNDVWIGRGAVILKGVTIGDGAIIAANAVLTKDVPPMEIWAGVPARFLRHRNRTDSPE